MNLSYWRDILGQKAQDNPLLKALLALVSDSLVYLAGSALIGLGNTMLVPLYTHYLTPAQFGVYGLVDVALLIMVATVGLGFNFSYLKWYAETDESIHPQLLGTMMVASTLAASLGGILLAVGIASPVGTLWVQAPTLSFAWMLLPLVVLENLQTVLLTDLRAKRRAVAFSIGSAVRLIGTVGASLWFVAIREQGVTGVFLGRFIGDAISVMILASFCLRGFQFGFSSDLIRPMVRFGAPVIWSALVVMLLDAFGRHFVSQYDTIEQVGIYAASMKVSKLMRMLLVQPVGVAWGGLMFQVSQWSKAQRVFSQAFMYISVTALLIATGAALFAPALFRLFATPAYFEGIDTFPLLLLAQVCAVVHYPASTGLYVKEKTHLFVPIYAGAVTVAFFASWLLVPNLGIRGAALGLVSGWIVILGLETLLGQKYYPLRIEWGVLIAAIVFCAIIVYIANHYTLGVSLTDIVLQLIFFVISVMILGGWIVADLARFGQWENKRSEPSPDQS